MTVFYVVSDQACLLLTVQKWNFFHTYLKTLLGTSYIWSKKLSQGVMLRFTYMITVFTMMLINTFS